jgi:hypothetical protein
MSDPYRYLEPLPPEQAKTPKRRIPWLLIAHTVFAIAFGYGTAYVGGHKIAPWSDFLNVMISILLAIGVVPHAVFEADRRGM